MALYFLDTSAVVKRYVAEDGSAWVSSLVLPPTHHHVYMADVTAVEVVSAVSRRLRGGTILPDAAAAILSQFRDDLAGIYRRLEIAESVIEQAMTLSERHGLRAYDAIQLAAALILELHCRRRNLRANFVCADVALNAAARAEGLTVDDPNEHP